VLHPDDYKTYMETENLSGEMGLHPVGNTCRKKFGKFAVHLDVSTW
jgi:hypothetical protein